MTEKPWRITPIQNLRQARQAASRNRDYNRRNTRIALAAELILGALLFVALRDPRTALQVLGLINFAFFAPFAAATIWMNMRNEPSTGLAAIRSTVSASIDEISLAMRDTFSCEPQRTERDGAVLLACETSRSNLSYGEWIVLCLRLDNNATTVEALSWNSSPTVTLGTNRRNLDRLVGTIGLRDVRELTHAGSGKVLARWVAAGILTGKPTPRPSWHSGTQAA